MKIEPKPGEFYSYTPAHNWAHEGLAEVSKNGVLVDLYWGRKADEWEYKLSPKELETAEFMFDSNECEELKYRQRWEEYRPEDRFLASAQHGCNYFYFVKKGAKPDLETMIAVAEGKVSDATRELASAEWRLKWETDELNKLLEQRG